MSVSHQYVFFEKCLFSSLAHFLIGSFIFLVLSCMSCLYIFEINSLLLHLLLFSPILNAVFSLAYSFLRCVKAFLSLIRSHLFIFAFISMTLEGGSGSCCDLCQRVFWLFSFRSFIVSDLTFKYLIHF